MDIRYAAGIIDGEGTIGIYVHSTASKKGARHPSVETVVSVTMTDKRPIKALHKKFGGGSLYLQSNPNKNHRDAYRWSLEGPRALALLLRIRRYLLVKRKQADLAVQMLRRTVGMYRGPAPLTQKEISTRLSMAAKMRRLNRRGRPLPTL